MLTVAISSFFLLALAGAVLTIVLMFRAYGQKIQAVIERELLPVADQKGQSSAIYSRPATRVAPIRTFQPASRRAPLAVAA